MKTLSTIGPNPEQTSSLVSYEPEIIMDEHQAIIRLKYSMQPIAAMERGTMLAFIKKILLIMSVNTGWRLTDNKDLLTVLQDQLAKKIIEDYPTINANEVEFAFRQYGMQITDWGKIVNITLFDTVMDTYLRQRRAVSTSEEKNNQPLQIMYKPTPEQLLNDRRELIETKYQSYLAGRCYIALLPTNGIETLAKDGYCDAELYKDYFDEAKRIVQKLDDIKGIRTMTNYLHPNEIKAENIACKIALFHCFERFKEAGYKNIYYQPEK